MKKLTTLLFLLISSFMFAQNSAYCDTPVKHLGIPAELTSEIKLTIANIDATSMYVEIESATTDPVDLLIIPGGSGATFSPPDTSVPGKIRITLSWMMAPTTVSLNVLWSKASFGGNWQLSPANISVPFAAACGASGSKSQIDLPITWNDTANVDYTVTDFGGNTSSVVVDPTDPTNMVLTSTKGATAMTWAGTTLSTPNGLATAIPFASGSTTVSVAVWSPDAGITIRLKAEDHTTPTISVETEATVTNANVWDTLVFDFSNPATGTAAINFANTYDMLSIFYNFGVDGATAGVKTYYCDDVMFLGNSAGPSKAQIDLPITWNDTANVDYTVTDFGGNTSSVVVDPTDPTNMVLTSTKGATAMTWAGTTLSTPNGLATAIPFASGSTTVSVAVWSPDAGITIRLKAEDHTTPTISVETEATVTNANVWDTLVFDFSNPATGTAAINFANTYDMLSIFYNFGVDGATAGVKTYYCDDVKFLGNSAGPSKAQIDLPITWNDTANVDYTVTDFGGNTSSVVVDPTDPTNMVLTSTKGATAMTWAGTTLSTPNGLATAIPFASGSTTISVAVWSPDAGITIRLKAEDHTDPTISVETEAVVANASVWDTLVFDFSNPAAGTAAINFANTYDMLSIFYNFGVDGATAGVKTYYCDNVIFGSGMGGGPSLAQIDLPITWNDTANVDYTVTDFGGNTSSVVVDPTDPTNMVLTSTKGATAMTWAGTTLSTPNGLATAIPFASGSTTISVAVWSPDAGITIRLKAEDHTDPTISVETEAVVANASVWDTLVFDFSNPAAGTAAINFANTYDMLSIFYNFGVDGATAGVKTYYCDNVIFGSSMGGGPSLAQIDLPITWNDTANVDYTVTDFGGNTSSVVVDPTDPTNMVLTSTKGATAMTWAGTTLSTPNGLATAIPFASGSTTISVAVWSPDAGITIRLKAEDHTDPTISVETEAVVANASVWDTLVFDFSNPAAGTAAINFANTYDMLSIFYNFGVDGATAGVKTYYCDNVIFGGTSTGPSTANVTFRVDLSEYSGPSYSQVNLNGTFNNFCGTCAVMVDANNDSIYELTVNVPADTIEYKFTLDGFVGEEQFMGGEPCTKTTGTFINRVLVPMSDTTMPAVCWESCVECNQIGLEESEWLGQLEITPNPSTGLINIEGFLNVPGNVTLRITDLQGRIVYQSEVRSNEIYQSVDLSDMPEGMYLVNLNSNFGSEVRRIIISR